MIVNIFILCILYLLFGDLAITTFSFLFEIDGDALSFEKLHVSPWNNSSVNKF